MRLALISKSRVAGLFVPLGPPPGLILTVGHVGCNRRCANLAVNAFLVPPQLYTVGIDINVKIADMAYSCPISSQSKSLNISFILEKASLYQFLLLDTVSN